MKEELESAVHLIQQYVPPQPDMMQVVMNNGGLSISPSPAATILKLAGYAKAGDALTLTFDPTVKALRQIDVATWLDKPEEKVLLKVTMEALPDGTSHPGVVTLSIPESKLEVRITKSNYQKLAQ